MSSSPLMTAVTRTMLDCNSTGPDTLEAALAGTLPLGEKLALIIDKDALVVLDNSSNNSIDKSLHRSSCGAFVASRRKQNISIPLYNVLWADVGDTSITVNFAESVSKTVVRPASLTYPFEKSNRTDVEDWVSQLFKAAYKESLLKKRFKVIINPFGGQGNAASIFNNEAKLLFEAAHCEISVENTERHGHAVEIAQNLDIDAYDAVVCCSGDGVPYEVFNGFGKRTDARRALKKVAVCQLPGGSGNAMCWNLTGTGSPSMAAVAIIKGIRKPLDIASITQGETRILSFLSQSVGIAAEADLGTEHLRWMGSSRFTFGMLQRVWKQVVYPCDLAVKVAIEDKDLIRDHYQRGGNPKPRVDEDDEKEGLPELKFGDINSPLPDDWELVYHAELGNFYAGNMAYVTADANLFPVSLPNDGMFDLICINGTLGKIKAAKTLLSIEAGSHFDMPHVLYRKILGYRIIPHQRKGVTEGYISVDGERIPFAPFQVEVHSGLGSVLAKGDRYETPGT